MRIDFCAASAPRDARRGNPRHWRARRGGSRRDRAAERAPTSRRPRTDCRRRRCQPPAPTWRWPPRRMPGSPVPPAHRPAGLPRSPSAPPWLPRAVAWMGRIVDARPGPRPRNISYWRHRAQATGTVGYPAAQDGQRPGEDERMTYRSGHVARAPGQRARAAAPRHWHPRLAGAAAEVPPAAAGAEEQAPAQAAAAAQIQAETASLPLHLGRLRTLQQDGVTVHLAIPTEEQAAKYFGVPLADAGIQPIWLRIENTSEHDYWLLPISIDPDYYSADEVALVTLKKVPKDQRDAHAEMFRKQRPALLFQSRVDERGLRLCVARARRPLRRHPHDRQPAGRPHAFRRDAAHGRLRLRAIGAQGALRQGRRLSRTSNSTSFAPVCADCPAARATRTASARAIRSTSSSSARARMPSRPLPPAAGASPRPSPRTACGAWSARRSRRNRS